MKILYIIESLNSGGKERRLLSLIKNMIYQGEFEIDLILLSDEIHYKEVFDLDIKLHFLKRNFKMDKQIFRKFQFILKGFDPDIVHCWDNIGALHFSPICHFKGIPFVNSMISTAPPRNLVKAYSKRFILTAASYPFSKIILSNSKAGLSSFRVPEKKGRYIHNGFDFNRIKNRTPENDIRKKFNITSKYVVGMTAAFHDRKDYLTFINAGIQLFKNNKDVTFLAIGDGPNLESMKNVVLDEGANNFRFLGRQNDVESIVSIFDIGILTSNSNVHGEGISNSIMEYMALGKPVVATIGGGTDEIVIDGETGFLIEEKNVIKLVEKIEYLLNDELEAKKMGHEGKKRIETDFSISNMVNKTVQLYNELIFKKERL